jgi:steroid delta-isomerase-like uncharacterized protein
MKEKETLFPDVNKAVVRRFIEEYQNLRNEESARVLLAEGFVDRSPIGDFASDKTGVMQMHSMLFEAFSEFAAEIHDQVAENDKVVTRKTFRGIHTGNFMGIPATGRPIEIGVIDILRVRNGKITEHWCQVDLAGLMGQITNDRA